MRTNPKTSTTDPIRLRLLIAELARSGNPSVRRAAARLGTSTRSLQRSLAEQKLTYSELVDSVRREIAEAMLATTSLPVQQIARSLGYCQPNSFARAFVRWTGVSPREYRRNAQK